jgi:hypothetical protein
MMLKIFVILAITENFQACMYCLVLVCKTKTVKTEQEQQAALQGRKGEKNDCSLSQKKS